VSWARGTAAPDERIWSAILWIHGQRPLSSQTPGSAAWAFHLDQVAAHRTRLLTRTRVRVEPAWALPALKWMGSGDTVMQRRLLDGIKDRAETTARR
jgi:hypothetical protein